MADNDPTGIILGAGIIVTGSTVIRDVHEGKTRAAPIVFGFLMVASLLIISYGSKTFARGLAYLSLVGAFVVNGPAVAGVLSGLSEPNTKANAEAAAGGVAPNGPTPPPPPTPQGT